MSLSTLQKLHELLGKAMLEEVQQAIEDGMPVPAADKAAIARFLKDNGVTADPAANTDLEALRAALEGRESKQSTKLQARIEELDIEAVHALYEMH